MIWEPFKISLDFPDPPRPISNQNIFGICDRIRAAAFAEMQAEAAFLWAAEKFSNNADSELIQIWKSLAKEEKKHMHWLLDRLEEMSVSISERSVSIALWNVLTSCSNPEEFVIRMADAEIRGRRAGLRFYTSMLKIDNKTAEIFKKIADEEVSHIEVAYRFYPEASKKYLNKPERPYQSGKL